MEIKPFKRWRKGFENETFSPFLTFIYIQLLTVDEILAASFSYLVYDRVIIIKLKIVFRWKSKKFANSCKLSFCQDFEFLIHKKQLSQIWDNFFSVTWEFWFVRTSSEVINFVRQNFTKLAYFMYLSDKKSWIIRKLCPFRIVFATLLLFIGGCSQLPVSEYTQRWTSFLAISLAKEIWNCSASYQKISKFFAAFLRINRKWKFMLWRSHKMLLKM